MSKKHIKFILLSLLFFLSSSAYSQYYYKSFCYYYDGYWGDWKKIEGWKMSGSYNGFSLYKNGEHPSNYFFYFEIFGRTPPDKKEIKLHRKSGEWWSYTGKVEYFVCDVYPTFKDCIKQLGHPLMKSDVETEEYQKKLSVLRASYLSKGQNFTPTGCRKVTSEAKIKIQPYAKDWYRPKVYNILFDNAGIGIDLMGCYF